MFEKIMVPVDGSKNSERALRLAASLQQVHQSEVTIVHIYRHHSLREQSMSMVRPVDPEPIDKAQHDYACEIVEWGKSIAEDCGATQVQTLVRSGPPARAIVELAKEEEMALIVLGSRGVGDLRGFLLGSVSHKVTSLSDIPVLVV